jgi:predicted CopG family antitoxin
MTRTINVVLDNDDYERLEKVKGERGWREFIMLLASMKVRKDGSKD